MTDHFGERFFNFFVESSKTPESRRIENTKKAREIAKPYLKRQGTMEILYEELEKKKKSLRNTGYDKIFQETRVGYNKQILLLERIIERIKALDEL